MATIAACPHCYTQLGLPETALETDVAQCPQCSGEFRLAEVRPLPLLEAKIVAAPATNAFAGLPAQQVNTDAPARGDAEEALIVPRAKKASEPEAGFSVESLPESEDSPFAMPTFDLPKWELPADVSEPAVAKLSTPEHAAKPNPNFAALRPRRRSSKIRLAVGVMGGGLLGCFLGLYGLLWMRGPSADYLKLARYLPQSMLPPSAARSENTIQEEEKEERTPEESDMDVSYVEVPAPSIRRDDAVQPATATAPVPTVQPLTDNISADEFASLLTAAREAQPLLLAGNFDDPETKQAKCQAYKAMCHLAEKIDALGDSNSEGDIQQATALFRWTLIRGQLTDDLGKITSFWWEHTSRPNQGIFFVGQVQSVQTLGKQSLYQIATGGSQTASTLPVLLRKGSLSQGQQVGIVGVIVSQPQQHLPELLGDASPIVVATRIFPLDAP